jgi:hypothetical protein
MDREPYPTKADLKRIKTWPHEDLRGLFDFILALWTYPEYAGFQATPDGTEYHLATGGWSGNESILDALHANRAAWAIAWVSSRRGGTHVFELRDRSQAVIGAPAPKASAGAGTAATEALRFCQANPPEVVARQMARDLERMADLESQAAAYHEVMGHLRALRMDHGLCQPRERRACTHCNAEDDLAKAVAAYRGPRVRPAFGA